MTTTANRATRRTAAAMQRRKDYGLLYYHFRGKWGKALRQLAEQGVIVYVEREEDGRAFWQIATAWREQNPGKEPLALPARCDHGGFLTSPETVAYIKSCLDAEARRTHGPGKRKRKR